MRSGIVPGVYCWTTEISILYMTSFVVSLEKVLATIWKNEPATDTL